MTVKQSINEMLDTMPSDKLVVVYNFVRSIGGVETKVTDMDCAILSEAALAKDWSTKEEDEFWKDL